MEKRRLIPLITILATMGMASCGGGQSSEAISTLYPSQPSFDYSLVDDPVKGKAIYPDEAIRVLHAIVSHNKEQGVDWPANPYSSISSDMTIDGEILSDYLINEEYYIPGQYYLHQMEAPWMTVSAEGYFQLDGGFYHGFRYLDGGTDRFYVDSSVDEMEDHWENHRLREQHYDLFMKMVGDIEDKELRTVSSPQDYTCYSRGEGDLYINIFHQIPSLYGNDRRVIARVVFEDYLPKQAICQTIDSIAGDEDYYDHMQSVRFNYGGVTPREDLDTFFGERRGA